VSKKCPKTNTFEHLKKKFIKFLLKFDKFFLNTKMVSQSVAKTSMGSGMWLTWIGGCYLTLLVACVIVFAVRGKDPNSTELDYIDYIGMIILAPIYIVVNSSRWLYKNFPWLLSKALETFLKCIRSIVNAIESVIRFIQAKIFSVLRFVALQIEKLLTFVGRFIISFVKTLCELVEWAWRMFRPYLVRFLIFCQRFWENTVVPFLIECVKFLAEVLKFTYNLVVAICKFIRNCAKLFADIWIRLKKNCAQFVQAVVNVVFEFCYEIQQTLFNFVDFFWQNFLYACELAWNTIFPYLLQLRLVIDEFVTLFGNLVRAVATIAFTSLVSFVRFLGELAMRLIQFFRDNADLIAEYISYAIARTSFYVCEFCRFVTTFIGNVIKQSIIIWKTLVYPLLVNLTNALRFLWRHIYSDLLYPLYYYLIYVPFYEWMYCICLYNAYLSLYKLYEICGQVLYSWYTIVSAKLWEMYERRLLITFLNKVFAKLSVVFANMFESVSATFVNNYQFLAAAFSELFDKAYVNFFVAYAQLSTNLAQLSTNLANVYTVLTTRKWF